MKTTAPLPPFGPADLFAAPPSFRPFDRGADHPLPGLFGPVTYRPFPGQPSGPLSRPADAFWSFAQ
ncbi:hypothetical protein [Aromatoleum anaerobium]|uniref:Uncharacterized protein n=1 Tax=Aromatoleum anaerobium TaxID=182180 RepID=A0ABX1PJS5_9RHOO|nr:hypothetical protein [Aromatoleum anaerobium]MCK0506653.1 hypothetical protein [Aromatoleum anaerobium]